jgi:hypothetical protein
VMLVLWGHGGPVPGGRRRPTNEAVGGRLPPLRRDALAVAGVVAP